MTGYYLYVDGSWLFKLCDAQGILAKQTETPEKPFALDFSKLTQYVEAHLSESFRCGVATPVKKYLYTSIFALETSQDLAGIDKLKSNIEARTRFVDSALRAGWSDEGVFHPPFKPWMLKKLLDGRYQEKSVDTSLVARLVERAITEPKDQIHVIVAGDVDMLAGIKVVVPDYSDRVVLVSTHPEQFDRGQQQAAFALNAFGFRHGPFYLEKSPKHLILGDHVFECHNNNCRKIFTRSQPLPRTTNPLCRSCHQERQKNLPPRRSTRESAMR